MAKSILVSSALPADALRIIPGEVTVDYNDTPAELSKAELIARLRGKDGLICHIISTIDDEVLSASTCESSIKTPSGQTSASSASCAPPGWSWNPSWPRPTS